MPKKTPSTRPTLVPAVTARAVTDQPNLADSLTAWIHLYGELEAGSNAANTVKAKGKDLALFMTLAGGQALGPTGTSTITLRDLPHGFPATVNAATHRASAAEAQGDEIALVHRT